MFNFIVALFQLDDVLFALIKDQLRNHRYVTIWMIDQEERHGIHNITDPVFNAYHQYRLTRTKKGKDRLFGRDAYRRITGAVSAGDQWRIWHRFRQSLDRCRLDIYSDHGSVYCFHAGDSLVRTFYRYCKEDIRSRCRSGRALCSVSDRTGDRGYDPS